MFSLDEKIVSANPKQIQRMQTLIVGRLLVDLSAARDKLDLV